MSALQPAEILKLNQVSFRFSPDTQMTLKEVNLSLKPSESFCLLGPTGCGKTTVLKLSAGLLVPTEGEVLFQGHSIQNETEAAKKARAKLVGMSFQRGGLLDCFNVGENIDFCLSELTRLTRAERTEVITEVLKKVGLEEAIDLPLKSLSGGMLKRLSIARAIVLEPKLLILDEPTAGLDPITSAEIVGLISTYQSETQATVFFVTSDLSVAFLLAQRLGFLSDGEIKEVADVNQFKSSQNPDLRKFLRGGTN